MTNKFRQKISDKSTNNQKNQKNTKKNQDIPGKTKKYKGKTKKSSRQRKQIRFDFLSRKSRQPK